MNSSRYERFRLRINNSETKPMEMLHNKILAIKQYDDFVEDTAIEKKKAAVWKRIMADIQRL